MARNFEIFSVFSLLSSSVKAFDKRDGSGAYNWGTPGDELPVRFVFLSC